MSRLRVTTLGLVITSLVAAALHAQSGSEPLVDSAAIRGVTAPSMRSSLSFSYQGIIGKVSVKKGDVISVGQALMIQDDRIEVARLEAMRLEADRSLVIKAKKAALANKRVELKRKKDLFEKKALAESEFLQAELEVVLAEAEVQVTEHEQLTKQAEVKAQEIRLAQLTLYSPIAGTVENILQYQGEVASMERPTVVVVRNDPMYIEVKTLSREQVRPLKVGQELEVRLGQESEWRIAKVNFIAPVSDPRATQHEIRLEIANPENRTTGESVQVRIPTPAQAGVR